MNIILVGDHPDGTTGNAHMMHGIATQLSENENVKFTICAINPRVSLSSTDIYTPYKWPILEAWSAVNPDSWMPTLLTLVNSQKVDAIMFVGLDMWMFSPILPSLHELKHTKSFVIISLFPYDINTVRKEWVEWCKFVDIPLVYSEYGYKKLKDEISDIAYFRPTLYDSDKFVAYTPAQKIACRKKTFHSAIAENAFIFGFVGMNQMRKDPQRLINVFSKVKKEIPNALLYMHMDVEGGEYNIGQYIKDCGLVAGDVYLKRQKYAYETKAMVEVYNMLDCFVSVSLQEGLNWPMVEAMLCGLPIIASHNTAHVELLKNNSGRAVSCTDLGFLPIRTEQGRTFIDTYACSTKDLYNAMMEMATKQKLRESYAKSALKQGQKWISGVNNINDYIEQIEDIKSSYGKTSVASVYLGKKEKVVLTDPVREKAVLFAQHSSAGDVFMTTRAFKGISERFKGLPIIYMTSPQFMNIIEDNPYISKVIPWNDKEFRKYQFILNPHGERIGPGHWGRNSNSLLSDFYWKILQVEPNDFMISKKAPGEKIYNVLAKAKDTGREIMILHTTGGDPEFRTYKYMADIARYYKDKYLTVQVGGENDYPADAELDLRGKLTYQETAWVVREASVAVTVDSFVSHLCGALGISQICLFGSGNHHVVRPNQMKGSLICRTIDFIARCPGLGPCSASIRDCPLPCTGIHDPKDIINDLDDLINNKCQQLETRISGGE